MLSFITDRTLAVVLGAMIGLTPAGLVNGPMIHGVVCAGAADSASANDRAQPTRERACVIDAAAP
jgi:hypothetical protein